MAEYIVGLIKDEHLDIARADHVTADRGWVFRRDVLTVFELMYVLAD